MKGMPTVMPWDNPLKKVKTMDPALYDPAPKAPVSAISDNPKFQQFAGQQQAPSAVPAAFTPPMAAAQAPIGAAPAKMAAAPLDWQSKMAESERKFGVDMKAQQLAPNPFLDSPAKPAAPQVPAGMSQADKFRQGMARQTEINQGVNRSMGLKVDQSGNMVGDRNPEIAEAYAQEKRGRVRVTDEAPAITVRSQPTRPPIGRGMNGAPALSETAFGTSMNGMAPPTAEPAPPDHRDAPNPSFQAFAPVPQEPVPAAAQQDPYIAKLEQDIGGAKIVQAGQRGAKRGATIKGGRLHGKTVAEAEAITRSQAAAAR